MEKSSNSKEKKSGILKDKELVILSILLIIGIIVFFLSYFQDSKNNKININEILKKTLEKIERIESKNSINKTENNLEELLEKYFKFRICLTQNQDSKNTFYMTKKNCGTNLKKSISSKEDFNKLEKINDIFCKTLIDEIIKEQKIEPETYSSQFEFCKFAFYFAIDKINLSQINDKQIFYFYSALVHHSSQECNLINTKSLRETCLRENS